MIRWLNMFGHGISYDDVAFVETALAEDEARNQISRSYCPTVLQPSMYVFLITERVDVSAIGKFEL